MHAAPWGSSTATPGPPRPRQGVRLGLGHTSITGRHLEFPTSGDTRRCFVTAQV